MAFLTFDISCSVGRKKTQLLKNACEKQLWQAVYKQFNFVFVS